MVACLLFFKPEDVPEILRQCGKIFRKIKDFTNEISSVFKDEDDIIRPRNKILGLDGKYHKAYDVNEVFDKDEPQKKSDVEIKTDDRSK
jgi:Sec-independent protein translocase protein TatA